MTMRRGRICVSTELLRLVLGLPNHLHIDGVSQTPLDRTTATFDVEVSGVWCPEVEDDAVAPWITPIYRRVETGRTYLAAIDGLDT